MVWPTELGTMRPLVACFLLFGGAAALFATRLAGSAEADPIVVRIGSSAITASGLSRNFERLVEFQRKNFGSDAVTQLRHYVEQVVVRDLLLAERGRQSSARDAATVRASRQVILSDALVESLRAREQHESPVTDEDVKAYYDAHSDLFQVPERIRIFRLLVDSQAEAADLITHVKQIPSMDDWRNLVREKSRDRATSERGGDLGFVASDGTTDVPELEVDRALFAAAQGVKDGELVEQPVPEARRFAVVWRRGSQGAKTLELRIEGPWIRQALANDRVESRLRTLITGLRSQHLIEHHPERLAGRDFSTLAEPVLPHGEAPPLGPSSSSVQP
jgi:peptidyl-prolyl cis-trans isomerase C